MALNFNNLKAPSGYLKLIHVILGAVALGIVTYYSSGKQAVALSNENYYFQLVTFAFLVTSFLLLVTILYDDSIKKSPFEMFYHLFGFIFYLSASIALMTYVTKWNYHKSTIFTMHIIASILGIVNSVAYLGNAFLAYRSR